MLPGALVGASVLAVVAHPDDETFGLGALLAAIAGTGSEVRVLCLTAGEASTLGEREDLAEIRVAELAAAAHCLGLHEVHLDGFPDGGLTALPPEVLDEALEHRRGEATVLVTFEPGGVTGHPDHRAASAAASRVAARHGLILAEWGVAPHVADRLRQETGVPFTFLDGPGVLELVVDRARQRTAIACHASQANGNAVLTRRLELQGDAERLRLRCASWS
jgi:LmbE family N-acetylglucosaminyl deacetylase